jgi:hypothetical protein
MQMSIEISPCENADVNRNRTEYLVFAKILISGNNLISLVKLLHPRVISFENLSTHE